MKRATHRAERGGSLVIVVISAVVFAIAAAAVLALSVASSQSAGNREGRLRARFAAESALVIAYQKLWNEATTAYPPGCPAGAAQGATTETVDTGNGLPMQVTVTVTNCGAGNEHKVTAKVSY